MLLTKFRCALGATGFVFCLLILCQSLRFTDLPDFLTAASKRSEPHYHISLDSRIPNCTTNYCSCAMFEIGQFLYGNVETLGQVKIKNIFLLGRTSGETPGTVPCNTHTATKTNMAYVH